MRHKFFLFLFFAIMCWQCQGLFLADKSPKRKATTAYPSGGLATPDSNDKNKKMKIDAANVQLGKLHGDHNWKARKEIITRAVIHDGIHPDALKNGRDSVLSDALLERDEADFDFAKLLLEHGADPNGRCLFYGPILTGARTPRTVQLFFDHGARDTVLKEGARLLKNALLFYDSTITQMYIDSGADVNEHHAESTSLNSLVYCSDGYIGNNERHLANLRVLMNAGALLSKTIKKSPHPLSRYTTPQILFIRSDEEQAEVMLRGKSQDKLAFFNQMRAVLIEFSNYRNNGLEADLISLSIPKDLAKLIVGYYIAQEPHYLELEVIP